MSEDRLPKDKLPEDSTTKTNNSGSLIAWRLYFVAVAVIGAFSLYLLLQGYSSSGGLLPGLSLARIMVLGLILAVIGLSIILLLGSWFRTTQVRSIVDSLDANLRRDRLWCLCSLAALLVALSGVFLITLTPEISEPYTKTILVRLYPVFLLITLISGLSLLVLVYFQFKGRVIETILSNKLFTLSLLVLLAIFTAWGIVARTILITESQATGLNSLGAPILDTQVFIAWTVGMFVLALLLYIFRRKETFTWHKRLKPYCFDISIGVLFWLITAVLWLSIPIYTNWFISVPRMPNYDFYPASDAFGYDSASQFLLAGEGFIFGGTPFIRRPLHALFLAFLHTLGGQDYVSVVSFQVILLAVLPTLFYFLGSILHNRVSGVIAAVLIMLREANSIAVSGSVTTSHAKMLMADLPATLTIVLFTLLAVIWFKKSRLTSLYPLAAGGVLALSVLIRFEAILFTIVVFFISVFVFHIRSDFRKWLLQIGLFTLGFVLVLSPWVWRNYQITGTIFIDSPTFRFDVIKARYKSFAEKPVQPTPLPEQVEMPSEDLQPTLVVTEQPAAEVSAQEPEEVPVYYKLIGIIISLLPKDTFISSAVNQAAEFISANPSEVLGFITTHYLNSQIQPVIYLPTTIRTFDSLIGFSGHLSPKLFWDECCSVQNYIRRMPYWRKWYGIFPTQAIVPVLLNMIFIAFGISTGWKKNKLVAMMPLFMSVIYFAVNALFRNSGGRYILPVDWVGMLYFSIGLSFISLHCYGKITKKLSEGEIKYLEINLVESPTYQKVNLLLSPGFYGMVLGLLLIGALLPAAEKAVPPRYSAEYTNFLIDGFFDSDILNPGQLETINQFIGQGGSVTVGRGMYPRFFPTNQGEEAHEKTFDPRPYPYLGFYVVGPDHKFAVLPVQDFIGNFPNAADVLVIGCPGEEGSVLAVGVFDNDGTLQTLKMRAPMPDTLTCPLEEPIPRQED